MGSFHSSRSATNTTPRGALDAWPALLTEALNLALPCHTPAGDPGAHRIHNLAFSSLGSDVWADLFAQSRMVPHLDAAAQRAHWSYDQPERSVGVKRTVRPEAAQFRASMDGADLVLIETSFNDLSDMDLAGMGVGDLTAVDASALPARKMRQSTELLIRLVSALPSQPSLLYVDASTGNLQRWTDRSQTVPLSIGAGRVQAEVAARYGVPYVSAIAGFGPEDTPERAQWWEHEWICDGNGHPSRLGHSILGQLVARLVVSHLLSNQNAPFPASPPLSEALLAKEPLFMAASELAVYTEGSPATLNCVTDAPSRAEGWVVQEEPGRPGRGGLGAQSVGARVSYALSHRRETLLGRLHVVLFKSYENVGSVRVTLSVDGREGGCGGAVTGGNVLASQVVDCLWKVHVSEPNVVRIAFDPAAAARMGGEFCVTLEAVESAPPRAVNRLKLISMSLF